MNKALFSISLKYVLLTTFILVLGQAYAVEYDWWNTSWHHRVFVEVNASYYDRVDMPIELYQNFSTTVSSFDNNSVRVIEYNSTGDILFELSSQFDEWTSYSSPNAVGEVVWILNGTTTGNTTRQFFIYFDSTDFSKSAPSYFQTMNYSLVSDEVLVNSSILEIKIDSNRSERTSGIYHITRRDVNRVISDVDTSEKTVEYLLYQNESGTKLGFNLTGNISVVSGPARTTIKQIGDEMLWNTLSPTEEGRITKTYYVYPDKEWLKLKQEFSNIGGSTISRGAVTVGSANFVLEYDARRGWGDTLGSTNPVQADPFSWQSTYLSGSDLGVGIININESVSNFTSDAEGFTGIGIELVSRNITAGSSIDQTSVLFFNNQSSHTPVQSERDRFATPLTVSQNSSDSFLVGLNGSSNKTVYNHLEEGIFAVNITSDSHSLTDTINLTLDMGTGDDVTLVLYDDGSHNDSSSGDGVYSTNYAVPASATTGVWIGTAFAYDNSGTSLNQTSFTFNVSSTLTLDLSISNPSGVVDRTVIASFELYNILNDTLFSGASVNCSFNGTEVTTETDLGNGTYTLNFSAPSSSGDYSLDCTGVYNNNTGNGSFSFSTGSAAVVPSVFLSPSNATVNSISQSQSGTFVFNTTVNNTQSGTAQNVNISLILPSGVIVDWSANNESYFCDDLSQDEFCSYEFNVTVAAQTVTDVYNVAVNISWTNLDGSSNSSQTNFTVNVSSNPLMSVIENNVTGSALEGSSTLVGNVSVNSTGNANLTNATITCISGDVCSNFTVAFIPSSATIESGDQQVFETNVTVPEGFSGGIYLGVLNITTNEGNYSTLTINVSVPGSDSWSVSPAACINSTLANSSGTMCVFNVSNTGNGLLNFSISPNSGNGSSLNQTSGFNLSVGGVETILVSFNSTDLSTGNYNQTYVISSNGTPSSSNFFSSITIVLGPIVTEWTDSVVQQLSGILLNISVEDLSGAGISNVAANITKPNGDFESVNLTNTSVNTPGGTSIWSYNFTNTTFTGSYNVTITAIDANGGSGSTTLSFDTTTKLNVSLSTIWEDYFSSETPSVLYNVTSGNGTALVANITLKVLDNNSNVIYLNDGSTGSDGKLSVVPSFTLPTDASRGIYTVVSNTSYFDTISNQTIWTQVNDTFSVHLPLEFDIETSIVWYANNVLQIYALVYGGSNITDELSDSSITLKIYDPAAALYIAANESNMSVVSTDGFSTLYQFEFALPSSPSMGMYLVTGELSQGDRSTFDSQAFRISAGGPFDLVIESIESEVAQGTNEDFTVRLENKGDFGLDVYLDYWITDLSNTTTYDQVEDETVFVGANANRSFDRELFIGSSQPTGNYLLHVRLNYSILQPILETSRTFSVVTSSGGEGGGGSFIPSVGAAPLPKYEVVITRVLPETIQIERGGTRYVTVEVLNTGNQNLTDLDIVLNGVPSSWYLPQIIEVLEPDKSQVVLMRIVVPSDEGRGQKEVNITAISERAFSSSKLDIDIFESKRELVRTMIDGTLEQVEEIEGRIRIIDPSKVSELVTMLEQAQELLRLAEDRLSQNELVESLEFLEKARNVLNRAGFLAGIQEEALESAPRLPIDVTDTLLYAGLAFLGVIAFVLVIRTAQGINENYTIRKIKKAALPKRHIVPIKKQPNHGAHEQTLGGLLNERVQQIIHERTSEVQDMLDLIKKEHQQGLISNETFLEMSNKYQKDMYYTRAKTCSHCGFTNERDARYCVKCGQGVPHQEAS